MIEITINPGEKRIEVAKGTLLLDALREARINISTPCGGKGNCGKCKVIIAPATAYRGNSVNPNEKKWLSEEEIKEGFRLACQYRVFQNCSVNIPFFSLLNEKDVQLQKKVKHCSFQKEFQPVVPFKKYYLTLTPPSLDDQRSDWTRIKDKLSSVEKNENIDYFISLDILNNLPELLRENNFSITVVLYKDSIIAIEAGDTSKELYGVAIDIGTTTIASYLVDLTIFQELAAEAAANPQFIHGYDVISRIDFASKSIINHEKLQQELICSLNGIIEALSFRAGIDSAKIYFAVLVGNTSMHHFLWNLPTRNLASSPYIPVLCDAIMGNARDLPDFCLIPNACVYSAPNVSAYIGGDIIADLIDVSILDKKHNCLLIDMGTNGEIVLKSNEKIWACSAAAGPAFEGARISSGMRATAGAIDRVTVDSQQIEYRVIGQSSAAGLCGSGIIDLIAGLLKIGLIKRDGRLISREECGREISEQIKERIIKGENGYNFLLVPTSESVTGKPIYLTQKDIREIQLAKGAVAAGIIILLKYARFSIGNIEEVLLAGSFGNILDNNSALSIGLIPDAGFKNIRSIGNAAGKGAVKLLLSEPMRNIADQLSTQIKYIELSAQPDFVKIFSEAMFFGPIKRVY